MPLQTRRAYPLKVSADQYAIAISDGAILVRTERWCTGSAARRSGSPEALCTQSWPAIKSTQCCSRYTGPVKVIDDHSA